MLNEDSSNSVCQCLQQLCNFLKYTSVNDKDPDAALNQHLASGLMTVLARHIKYVNACTYSFGKVFTCQYYEQALQNLQVTCDSCNVWIF